MEDLKMRQTQNASKKDNRKSILVIGLLLLLVAVIGFGGYTMSKYVTKKSVTHNATVAKWGFTINANADGIFGKNYKYDSDKRASVVTTDNTASLTVKASDDANRVAPGTTGSMTFNVTGTAEVKAQISFSLTVEHDVSLVYTKDGKDETYAPVKWTLKKGENVLVNGLTLNKVKEALEAEDAKTTYQAGAAQINDTYTLEWAWAFDGDDVLDTYLGTEGASELPAGCTKKSMDRTIGFTLGISVVQLPQ